MPDETRDHQLLRIPFAGPGAGTAPLTWGQKAILQDMRETGWTHNSSGAHALPEGMTVDQVAGQLGELLSRHPALRMRLGTDEQGNPCQVVAESGEVPLEVITFADEVEPADVAKYTDQLWYDWLLTPFDLEVDWAVRTAVIRHRDQTLYRVLTFNHVSVDGTALGVLMPELGVGEPVSARRPNDPEPVGLLELARREQAAPARAASDRAMRYWRDQLSAIPPLTFGEPVLPGRQGQRYWHGRFGSPATYLAVLAIAERTRTDSSRVLHALIAIAIGRARGLSRLSAKVIMSNRFRPGFAEAIAPLSQNSVITIDLADAAVDEVVVRTRQSLLAAGMYSYYDPDQLTELIEQLDAERGYPARVSCRINDRRLMTGQSADQARGAQVTRKQIEQLLPETFLSWDGPLNHLHEQAFITVEDRADTVYLQVIFDMACFTEEQVENLLHGLEAVAIEAAFDPTATTGVTSVVPGDR